MKCPNCGTETTDPFCPGCGADLTQQTQTGTAGGAAATATGPALVAALPVVTLSFNGRDFPLVRGAKILIARKGSDKCQPDIEIESDSVSSTPIEVSVDENNKITVRDTGTTQGIRVVKFLQAGESIEAKPGEMIMAGNEIITLA